MSHPKTTRIVIISDGQDPFLFLHHRSQVQAGMLLRFQDQAAPSPTCSTNAPLRSLVLFGLIDITIFSHGMRVHGPVHGMQGVF